MHDFKCLRCNEPIEPARSRLGALFCLDCAGTAHVSQDELLRAECNRLASERDLLRKENEELAADNRRLLLGARNLLAHNRTLSLQLRRALTPERRAA